MSNEAQTVIPQGELKLFHYIGIIFALSFVTSNLLATKVASIYGLSFATGIIVFPMSYICSDILTEVYGYKRARSLVWFVMICGLLFAALCRIAIALPPASFWSHQAAFETTLSSSWRIFIASNIAYFIGDFTNCRVIAVLKLKYHGKMMGLRFIGSTVIGTAVDNALFMLIAFIGVYSFSQLCGMIFWQYLIKVTYEGAMLPISVEICKWLKREEKMDIFDTNTKLTPFSLDTTYPLVANRFIEKN